MVAKEAEIVEPEKGKKSKAIARRDNGAAPMSIETLIGQAVQTGNIDTIERVFALREKMRQEHSQEAFDQALSNFRAVCPVIPKKRKVHDKPEKGGKVRYSFAALEDVDRIVRPLLSAEGLSYTTKTTVDWQQTPPRMKSVCIVRHVEGHREETPFETPVDLDAYMTLPQKYASAASFCERYAVKHALGLTFAGEDNDAEISPQDARKQREPVRQPQQTPTAQKKATNGPKEKVQLEPAASEAEAIDAATQKGLAQAMAKGTLTEDDFLKRFPKLSGLDQVRKADARVVMSFIADPQRN